MRHSAKLYRRLLSLYPVRFREEYQTPMERQFVDDYREASTRWDRTRVWQRAVWDIVLSAPEQLLSEFWFDLKHGLRAYRSRLFSMSLAIVALGLAIGASTGIFSVLNALLLRKLPFSHPAQLTELWLSPVSAMQGRAAFTDWHRHSAYLQSAAAFSSSEMNLAGDRDALRVKVAETSCNFFDLLGVPPILGRSFARDEDILGHNAVAVISYGLWQQLFGGEPDVLGKTVGLNGHPFTVIGVLPASFDYPGKTNVWTPTVFDFEKIPKQGAFLVQTIGRLKQGVTIRQAREMFEAEVRRATPQAYRTVRIDEQNRPNLFSLQDRLAGPLRESSWVAAGMTFLVLLIACANVAQLILSRVTERRQELAIRAALGASRARLLQQLTTEATFLTVTSAALGVIVAKWTSGIASTVAPAQLATQQYRILDWRVIGFAIALAVVMGIVLGVAPSWFVGRLQLYGEAMRNQRGTRDRGTKRARAGLTILQAALTLCLVTSSLALGRAFVQLLHTDLGFHPANVVTLNVSLQGTRHNGRDKWEYYREVLNKLRALPEVEAAGAVRYLPLAKNIYMAGTFKLDSGQTVPRNIINAVTPGYFRAMGTTFLAGRDFEETQQEASNLSVIVNEAFAQQTGLGKRIIGRKLSVPWQRTPYTITGVVSTARITGPVEPGTSQIYWSIEEEPGPTLTMVAKVRGSAEDDRAMCRDEVRTVDPEVPIYDVKTLDQRLDDVLSGPRFYAKAAGFLALLAAVLAAVAVYGTTAYSIAQRTHEMGVRMAVGASYGRVRGMMLWESMKPVLTGMAAGLILSLASGRFLEHLIDTAQPAFSTWTAAAGLLLLAALIPGWRATARILSVDPVEALRAE